MPAITPPDLRNVKAIASPTETYRKVSMPTVYCKSHCTTTPGQTTYSWTPVKYVVIGTDTIAYDYTLQGVDEVLRDNIIKHYACGAGISSAEMMDASLFSGMDGKAVKIGTMYGGDLNRWVEVAADNPIRFGYSLPLAINRLNGDPNSTFDISIFGNTFNNPDVIWTKLPAYIILSITDYDSFVAKPPFTLEAKEVTPNKRKDRWVIARLVVNYDETQTQPTSTWTPPTSNNFLTTQAGAAYTPPTNQHICYISDPNSPYYGRYYTKNSGTGYTELTTHVPWLWRNSEPFYIKNEGSTGLGIEWVGPQLGTSLGDSTRHVWANIIVNSSGQIINTWISDYGNNYGNQGKIGSPIQNNSTLIPAGCKCYIFRLDQSTTFKYIPVWANEGTWECRGCFNDSHQNFDSYAWTPGASYFSAPEFISGSGSYIITTPWNIPSSAHVSIGGCLSSLFIPCAVSGYSYVNSQAGYTAAQAFAQEVFTNPTKHCWINQNVSFRADGLFERVSWLYDAKNLEFPVTAVPFMYNRLFYSCQNLQHAPAEFPAFQIAPAMYGGIFNACYSLQDCPMFYANRMWNSTGIYPSKTDYYNCYKRYALDDGVIQNYDEYEIDISNCGMTDGFTKVTHTFDGWGHMGERIPSIGLPDNHIYTKAIACNNSNVWTAHLRPTILGIDSVDGGYTWTVTNTYTTDAQKMNNLHLNHDPTVNNIDTESSGKYAN